MKQRSKFEYYRLGVQTVSLSIFVVIMLYLVYPLEWRGPVLVWFSRLDPWFLFSQLRWQHNLPMWAWLPLLTLLVTALWGRLFCGWICPLGGLLAWTDKLGGIVGKKVRRQRTGVQKVLHPYRYYWLLLLGVVFVLGSNWVLFFTPFSIFSHELSRAAQRSIPWILLIILAATLFWSRLWCSMFCPTGVLLSLVATWRPYRYTTDGQCIRCGKCSKTCPVDAAPAEPGLAKAWCLVCDDCREICPVNAITYERQHAGGKTAQELPLPSKGPVFSRRQFTLLAVTLAAAAILWRKTAEASRRFLRPPGALEEAEFNQVCSRCGRCIQVCPNRALWPLDARYGAADLETPVLVPRIGRCDLCMACQEICPTGAIAQVPAERVRIGQAVVDKERCLAWSEHKLCFLCGEQCPFQAISGDRRLRPTVIAEKCVGCGACENGCPVIGVAAIRVYPR